MPPSSLETPLLKELGALVAGRLSPASVPMERWPGLVELAMAHGLGSMLWWVLRQANHAIPDRRLEKLIRWATISSLALRAEQRGVQEAFASAAIPAIWLKGIALAQSVYPRPALRPMVDIDVLVPYEQRRLALAAAGRLGYALIEHDVVGADRELRYHYALRRGGSPTTLEIHWRLLETGGKKSLLPLEHLAWFRDPRQLTRGDDGLVTLSPEAHLLYLCAHAILQHGEADCSLLRFFDLHLLILAAGLDWQIVVDRAEALRWSLAVERALVLTQSFFATPVPDWVFVKLRASARNKIGGDVMFDLERTATHVDRFLGTYGRLETSTRVRMARAVLLPSPAYMRKRYNIADGRAVLPYYPLRWFSQGRSIVRSLLARRTKTGTESL